MGLLDPTEDPGTMGLLSLGLGMLNSRGNFGQALGQAGPQALQAMQAVKEQQARRKQQEQTQQMQALQMQQAQMQIAEAQRAQRERDQQQALDDKFRSTIQAPAAAPLAQSETPFGAFKIPGAVDPKQQMLYQALVHKQIKPMEYMTLAQKDTAPIKLGAGEALIDPGTYRTLYTNPKENTPTEVSKLLAEMNALPPGDPRRSTYLDAIKKATTHMPSAQVNVNTDSLGLKPKDKFEMEQKLSADYSTATKLDRSIISTAEDISSILKQGGALKDQAAIYKFAKALDPDGAVREADYAAIVRTAGGLDYVKGLVNKALTGEQLLPKQREEMTRVVNAMAEVAKNRIGQTQRKTGANAKLYNLNPDNIFSAADNDGWAILPGGK